MQLRKPFVLRLHKFNKTKNPHEYYFSELQLYYPFTDESHLFPEDSENWENLYKAKKDQILIIKSQVMKHLTAVEEGRERAEEMIANEIGDQLDSNIVQENEDAALEDADEHPDLFVLNPPDIDDVTGVKSSEQEIYRKTELVDDMDLSEKILNLD